MPDCHEHIPILFKVGKKTSFKLQWLPVLARNEVVRSMDINDISKLSLSSRRMAAMVGHAKVKVGSFEIHVNIHKSVLKIESLNKDLYQCGPDHQREESNNFGSQTLSRLIDKSSTSFRNCVSMFKHLQNSILFKSLCLHVNFEGMTVQFFKEILSEPALKDFEFLCLEKGEIDVECLNLAMETAHSNRDLHIKEMKVPEDYYHRNAFKFYDIFCCEAKWVRIEHLFTSNNRNAVILGINNLTYFDLNTYIKFWIDNDNDMLRLLRLTMSATFQPETLFDGIIVLQGQRGGSTYYLVAANPTKERKRQIMGVGWCNNKIHFRSWGKDQLVLFQRNVYVDSWEREYKILRILNKKKKLEIELEKIQNLLETGQDQTMIEKKNDISRELQIVSVELDKYKLVFRNGFYISQCIQVEIFQKRTR